MDFFFILKCLFISIIWGSSNPAISFSSRQTNLEDGSATIFQQLRLLFSNPLYVISILFNSSASFLYYALISRSASDLSLASPIINSLTTFFTCMAGTTVFREQLNFNPKNISGAFLIFFGSYLCLTATAIRDT
ncbi:hypothetical protein SNEBB_005411 [Seison nebaliae]|nr:hypothetical protein SNEBB_005411 [Seison nebaliae]